MIFRIKIILTLIFLYDLLIMVFYPFVLNFIKAYSYDAQKNNATYHNHQNPEMIRWRILVFLLKSIPKLHLLVLFIAVFQKHDFNEQIFECAFFIQNTSRFEVSFDIQADDILSSFKSD